MATRSKRLFGPTNIAAGPTVVYTCPAGETAIVKQLSFSNAAALAQTVALYINANTANSIVGGATVPAASALVLTGWFLVLQPGDTLRIGWSGTGGAVSGHGAELEGVAD